VILAGIALPWNWGVTLLCESNEVSLKDSIEKERLRGYSLNEVFNLAIH